MTILIKVRNIRINQHITNILIQILQLHITQKLVVTFKVRDFYCHSIYINFILTDTETLHSDMKNYFEIRKVNVILQLKYFHNHVNETKLVKYRMIKKSVQVGDHM